MTQKKNEDDIKKPRYPVPPGPGRDPDLTPEVQKKICDKLVRGNYVETAAACAGIHKSTLYRWLKRGAKEPGSIYAAFSDAVERAEAEWEDRDVTLLDLAAHGAKAQYDETGRLVRKEIPRDPKVAMWRLERKRPKNWGRTDKHEITGKEGGPLTFTDFVKELSKSEGEEDENE